MAKEQEDKIWQEVMEEYFKLLDDLYINGDPDSIEEPVGLLNDKGCFN